MEIPGRDCGDKQERIQSYGSSRGSGLFIRKDLIDEADGVIRTAEPRTQHCIGVLGATIYPKV